MFRFVSKSILIIAVLALALSACGTAATSPAAQESQAPAVTEGGAPAAGTG